MASDQKKKLQKLSRMELLELLLEQTSENERLREKLQKAEELLAQRHLAISVAGDLAHAVLAVNGVMDAANKAAQQYIENAQELERQTQARCARMLSEAEAEAKRVRYEALLGENLATEILEDAKEE